MSILIYLLNSTLAFIPLLPSAIVVVYLLDSPHIVKICYTFMIALAGFFTTSGLVPVIAQYTLKRRLCGKDLCKKGSKDENVDM